MSTTLQAKIDNASKAIKANQEKYDKLAAYATSMTNGYVKSIELVIDMTKILSSIKKLLDELTNMGIKGDQLQTLKNETNQKLTQLSATLNSQFDTIKSFVNDGETQTRLAAINQAFEEAKKVTLGGSWLKLPKAQPKAQPKATVIRKAVKVVKRTA